MSTSNVNRDGRFVPRVGAVVAGKYRIERKLGEGGMGFVVAASHLALGGQVALKFLSPDEEVRDVAVTRLTREAQSVARIKSEHVARVLDMGTLESGDPYIVMELLEGMDLHKVVRKNGPLPVAEAIEYVLQAAEGVADAHSFGIVHRDLKPANLFLSHKPDGSPFVRVLDFGIAKNLQAQKEANDVSLTAGTDVLGSPLYMAPEQIRNPKGVDPRADIWSLGAILYKLLTGRAAFEADNPSATLAMIVMDEATPLRNFRPDIPPALEAIVHRCLEKKLEQRFQSVDELACALLPFAPARPRGRPWVATSFAPLPATSTTPTATASPETNSFAAQTMTAATIPTTVTPGQTSRMSTRSIVTITVAVSALAVGTIALVVAALMTNSSKAMDVASVPTTNAPALPLTSSTPHTEIQATPPPPGTSMDVPSETSRPIVSAIPSASNAPLKSFKRPTRNDALDDRL